MNIKKKCFGTSEFCSTHGICKHCKFYKECGDFVRKKYGDEIVNLTSKERRKLMR